MRRVLGVVSAGALGLAFAVVPTGPDPAGAPPSSASAGHRVETPSLCNTGLKPQKQASDEFNDGLDARRWKVYDYAADGRHSQELAYRPDMTVVDDGSLALSIVDEPEDVDGDGSPEYPAGGVESYFDVPGAEPGRASCVEVRTQGFAANLAHDTAWDQNVFSAVWLQTRGAGWATNPNPEIDIQEFFVTDKQHMALHTWESPPPPEPPIPADHTVVDNCRTGRADKTVDPEGLIDDCPTDLVLPDLTTGMHVFGLRREIVEINGRDAGLLTFYVDGRPTWQRELPADSPFVTRGRHLVLSTQGNPPGPPRGEFPKVALHDWVRTYN